MAESKPASVNAGCALQELRRYLAGACGRVFVGRLDGGRHSSEDFSDAGRGCQIRGENGWRMQAELEQVPWMVG